MGWERGAHLNCRKPFTGHFRRVGSIWRCRKCGSRWQITGRKSLDGLDTETTWTRISGGTK